MYEFLKDRNLDEFIAIYNVTRLCGYIILPTKTEPIIICKLFVIFPYYYY